MSPRSLVLASVVLVYQPPCPAATSANHTTTTSPRSAHHWAPHPRRSTAGPDADCHLSQRLHQFDAVAERVIDIGPEAPIYRLFADWCPRCPQALDEAV